MRHKKSLLKKTIQVWFLYEFFINQLQKIFSYIVWLYIIFSHIVFHNLKQRTTNIKKAMKILFFMALVVLALSCCDFAYICSLRKEYRKWRLKLFKEREKPSNWALSRGINYKRYIKSRKTMCVTSSIFVVISILCVENISAHLMSYTIPFLVAIALSCVIGLILGRNVCDKEVLKECNKCGIDRISLWKIPNVFLGIFCYCKN